MATKASPKKPSDHEIAKAIDVQDAARRSYLAARGTKDEKKFYTALSKAHANVGRLMGIK